MDAQTFLYWALAGGFILLVLFLCIAIFHLIRILKDFADASDKVKETAEIMNENVTKIADQVTHAAEQISEYVVKPFTVIQYITERVKPMIEMIQQKGEELQKSFEKGAENNGKHKKKKGFGRKK